MTHPPSFPAAGRIPVVPAGSAASPTPNGGVASPGSSVPRAPGGTGEPGPKTPAPAAAPPAAGTGQAPAERVTGEGARSAGFHPHTWTIEMPAGMELLNANDRSGHWGRRQRLTDELRQAAGWLAKRQHIPRLSRAHILGVYEPPNRHKRDPANYYPSFKACIDGIVADAGVLPGDDAAYLDGPDMRLGEPYPRGRLVLHVTEVTDEATAGAA